MKPLGIFWALLALATVAGTAVLPGCGSPQTTRERQEVRRALLGFHESLVTGDKQQHLSYLRGSEREMEVMASRFELFQATYDFQDRMIDLHGEEAWKAFDSRNDGLNATPPRERDYWQDLKIVVMGDRARMFDRFEIGQFHMYRDEKGWHMKAYIAQGANPDSVQEAFEAKTRILREYAARLEYPNVDIHAMAGELDKRFQEAMDEIVRQNSA
ncbi:MAG: hypothetical protein ACOC93_00370 [Planctomycetota bacterium]